VICEGADFLHWSIWSQWALWTALLLGVLTKMQFLADQSQKLRGLLKRSQIWGSADLEPNFTIPPSLSLEPNLSSEKPWTLRLHIWVQSDNSSPFPSRGKLKGMRYAGETNRRCLLCSCALSNCFNGLELQRDRLTFAHVYTVPPYCWLCRSPKLSTVCFQCYFKERKVKWHLIC